MELPASTQEARMQLCAIGVALGLVFCLSLAAASAGDGCPGSSYAAWPNGPPSDPSSFPIGVWLQDPANAAAYRELGINVYIGLWEGRELRAVGGRFEDSFAPYDVHLYRMKMGS